MRERKYTTLLDPFQEKYGKRTTAILYIPALIGEIFWTAAILVALGATFSLILGIDFHWAIIISAVMAIGYTFFGGLWAVAYTDVVQLIFILFGLGIAIPFAMGHVGDFSMLWQLYQERFADFGGLLPPSDAWSGQNKAWGNSAWIWLDYAFLLIFGGIPWGVYFQRVLSSPSPKAARSLSIFAGFACLLLAIPPTIIGMIATQVDWTATAAGQAPEGTMVLPYVLQYLTPPIVSMIGLAAVAAAVMSSIDSSILSVSSMFIWNVYRPFTNNKASDKHMINVMRVTIVIAGVIATWLALTIQSVYTL